MQKEIYLEANQVPANLKMGYSGKKFSVVVTERINVPADAGIWGGGSRDSYRFMELATGRTVTVNAQTKEEGEILPVGVALVRHSIFCGKDFGLTFYVRPENTAALLPDKSVELNADQKLVLKATKELKSSYNGKDRYENSKPYGAMSLAERAARQAQVEALFLEKGNVKLKSGKLAGDRIEELKNWALFFPSREEWEKAKTELIGLGLLNKAGAITVKGRNACK